MFRVRDSSFLEDEIMSAVCVRDYFNPLLTGSICLPIVTPTRLSF